MLVLPCDCCDVTVAYSCCPCDIPQSDLTLTYASTGPAGNGSMTLSYTPQGSNPPIWLTTTCLDLGVLTLPVGNRHCWISFYAYCSNGATGWDAISWYQSGDTGCTGYPPGTGGERNQLTIDSFTCAPFHLHHNVGPSNGFPASVLIQGGFTTIDLDSSESTSGTCLYKFNVSGCNFIATQGVTVSAWTSAAKTTLLGTGATDSNGDITIVSTERTTNGHYEITGSRFTSLSGNGLLSSATSTNNFNLTATASYHCDTGICGWPIAGTLHMTHPVFGSVTLTYSSGHWTGTKAYSYPGNIAGGGSCAGATVTVSFDMDEGYGYTESWKYDGSGCPTDSGGNTATAFWTFENVDCYVPSVTAFSANFSKTPFAGEQENLYGSSFLNLSITE